MKALGKNKAKAKRRVYCSFCGRSFLSFIKKPVCSRCHKTATVEFTVTKDDTKAVTLRKYIKELEIKYNEQVKTSQKQTSDIQELRVRVNILTGHIIFLRSAIENAGIIVKGQGLRRE